MSRTNPLPAFLRPNNLDQEVPPHLTYSTFSLNLASALVAADVLDLLYMEVCKNKVVYVFEDRLRIGSAKAKLYYEKDVRTFPLVHPALYVEVRGCLLQEQGRLLNDKSPL